jgi:hypothetical protein
LSTFSGLLLAGYFVPVWTLAAWRIVLSPIHGLFERPNVAVAMFISDYLQFPPLATVRFAWLLAIMKLTVVAFFLVFAALTARATARRSGACDEALSVALSIGSVITFASMMFAVEVHEAAALQLHATELMLLLSTAILMLVDQPSARASVESDVRDADYALSNPSS